MEWFKVFKGDQETISEAVLGRTFGTDATIVVLRAWGDGVDPIYSFEKKEGMSRLVPFDKRFEEYEVFSFEEACEKFVSEFCPYESSQWELAICLGTRGLSQYLITTDSTTYALDVVLEKIHGDQAVMTLFKCAEKLGLKMHIESKIGEGEVTAYPVSHKLNIGNRACYLMDIASSIKQKGAIITMDSPLYQKEEVPVKKKKRFFFF